MNGVDAISTPSEANATESCTVATPDVKVHKGHAGIVAENTAVLVLESEDSITRSKTRVSPKLTINSAADDAARFMT